MRFDEGEYNKPIGLVGLDALRGEFHMTMGDLELGYFLTVDPLTRKNEYATSYANSSVCAAAGVKCKALSWC